MATSRRLQKRRRVGALHKKKAPTSQRAPKMQKKIRISDLLYPHWFKLSLAFAAVIGESLTDLLEPWPLKVVFDYVFASKRMPEWLAGLVGWIGTDKFSILNFAVLAVLTIAIFGA